jgi:hypothetical protein
MIPASGAGGPEFDSRSGPNLTFLPVALTIATYLALLLLLLLTYHIIHLPCEDTVLYCTVCWHTIRTYLRQRIVFCYHILRDHAGLVGCNARNGHEDDTSGWRKVTTFGTVW